MCGECWGGGGVCEYVWPPITGSECHTSVAMATTFRVENQTALVCRLYDCSDKHAWSQTLARINL